MKNLVISTGAGISAESGISTFRDAGGLWENYDVMEVASHEGFLRNPELIHRFYNQHHSAGCIFKIFFYVLEISFKIEVSTVARESSLTISRF